MKKNEGGRDENVDEVEFGQLDLNGGRNFFKIKITSRVELI